MSGWLIYLLLMMLVCALYGAVLVLTMPGLYEERFGGRTSLPAGYDEWRPDETSAEGMAARQAGRVREQRYLLVRQPSLLLPGRLHKQVRVRNAETGEIERVEPDRRVSFKEMER